LVGLAKELLGLVEFAEALEPAGLFPDHASPVEGIDLWPVVGLDAFNGPVNRPLATLAVAADEGRSVLLRAVGVRLEAAAPVLCGGRRIVLERVGPVGSFLVRDDAAELGDGEPQDRRRPLADLRGEIP
jgi:hypothetical protein